jgi:hypothetical protein
MRATPGIENAALSYSFPFRGANWPTRFIITTFRALEWSRDADLFRDDENSVIARPALDKSDTRAL